VVLEKVVRKVRAEGVPALLRASVRAGHMTLGTAFLEGPRKYSTMQRIYYGGFSARDTTALKNVVIGNYEAHQRYPYEGHLLDGAGDCSRAIALDFGCGPGRMILRMAPFFARVDGVDISPALIRACKSWTSRLANPPRLFVNDGATLGGIDGGGYDFVYSTIAFHHIAPYGVRLSLLREFRRVLRPGGRIALQLVYTDQPRTMWARHADWLENPYRARGTNSTCDVRVTPANLPQVEATLGEVGFRDFRHRLTPPPHPLRDATHWIFVYAEAA
jgi:SAM-dependent methyltransferase